MKTNPSINKYDLIKVDLNSDINHHLSNSNQKNKELDLCDNISPDPYHSTYINKDLVEDITIINQEFNNIKNDNLIHTNDDSSLK